MNGIRLLFVFALLLITPMMLFSQDQRQTGSSPVSQQYSKPSYGYFDPTYKKDENRQHLGVDYPAPKGSPVYSTIDGRVISNNTASVDPTQSRVIIQQNGTSLQTVTGHINSTTTPGMPIRSGQYIGETQRSDLGVHYGVSTKPITPTDNWGWGRAPAQATHTDAANKGWVDPQRNGSISSKPPVSLGGRDFGNATAGSTPQTLNVPKRK